MAVTDIATRTWDHGFRLDPIVRSLLDTDFYKLLMLQMIRHLYPDARATFGLINRSKNVRLADTSEERELRAQLDHDRRRRADGGSARHPRRYGGGAGVSHSPPLGSDRRRSRG